MSDGRRWSALRRAGGFAAIAMCGAVGACGVSTSRLNLCVRDAATHEPARDVLIVADVPSKDHPFSVATFFGNTTPMSFRGRTDASGKVSLEFVAGRPVRLSVLEQGWSKGCVMLDAVKADRAAWVSAMQPRDERVRDPEYQITDTP